jgi:hypothetical protein
MKQAVTPGENLCKLKGLDIKIEPDRRTFMTSMVTAHEAMRVLETEVWTSREPWNAVYAARTEACGASGVIRPILNATFAARIETETPVIMANALIVADAKEPNMLYLAKPDSIVPQTALRQFKYRISLAGLISQQDQLWQDQLFAAMFTKAYLNAIDMRLFAEHQGTSFERPGGTIWNDKTRLIEFSDGTNFTCDDVVENGWFNLGKVVAKALELTR